MGRPLTRPGQLFGMDGAGMFIEEALPMAEELELQGPAGPAPAVPQSSRPALEAAEEEAEQGSMF